MSCDRELPVDVTSADRTSGSGAPLKDGAPLLTLEPPPGHGDSPAVINIADMLIVVRFFLHTLARHREVG